MYKRVQVSSDGVAFYTYETNPMRFGLKPIGSSVIDYTTYTAKFILRGDVEIRGSGIFNIISSVEDTFAFCVFLHISEAESIGEELWSNYACSVNELSISYIAKLILTITKTKLNAFPNVEVLSMSLDVYNN